MMDVMFIGLILFMAAAFLVLLTVFLLSDSGKTGHEKGVWGRLHDRCVLVFLKCSVTIDCGIRYVHLLFETIFKGYPGRFSEGRGDRIRGKEMEMERIRGRMKESQAGYVWKDRYNMKILK